MGSTTACIAGNGRRCGGNQDLSVHNSKIVDVANVGGEEERGFLAERAANVSAVLNRIIAGIGRAGGIVRIEEWILGVERGIVRVD